MIQLLSIEQLAERLYTTPTALYSRRCRDPYLLPPVVKIPGDVRIWFVEETVDAWILDPGKFIPDAHKPKRQPGRPRKYPKVSDKAVVGKRGRGRPPKHAEKFAEPEVSP